MTSASLAAAAAPSLAELAAAVSRVRADSLDVALRERAAQRVFDSLAAAALGFATPEGRCFGGYLAALPASDAAAWTRAHVAAARTTEIDDIDTASCTTAGAVVVPAAVSGAVALGADGARLLEAVSAGYEAMLRLGRAIGGATLIYRGVWPTYVTAAFGAAAVSARLLALDAAETARALALALSRTALPPAGVVNRPGFRYYALGCAAADGMDAARAAAAGVHGDAEALAAFATRLDVAVDAAVLSPSDAVPPCIAAVDTKLWPSSRQALASVAAFLELRSRCEPDEIARVEVAVPPAYRQMIDRPALPTQRIESLLGVQYQLALAALAPECLDDALRIELRADERVAAFLSKIDVRADAVLGARFPRLWGSRVSVTARSGRTFASEVLEPPGSGSLPLAWSTLAAKHERIYAAGGLDCSREIARLRQRCGELASPGAQGECAELRDAVDALRDSVQRGAGRG